MLRIFILIILFINTIFALTISDAQNSLKIGDTNMALKIYKQLARQGDKEANFNLGVIYFKGKKVKKDLNQAMKYFQRASASGQEKAKYNVAIIYANKNYTKYDLKKSYQLFEELANLDNPKAQNKLALFLTYGLGGINKDYKQAVSWLEKAYFEHNYFPASCNLAFMFAEGKGVFPNFGRARKLAQEGYEKKLPKCVKVYKEYKLHKYTQDKGFKYGYYKGLN